MTQIDHKGTPNVNPIDTNMKSKPSDLNIQYGLKKEALDNSWKNRFRRLIDTSAHRTYEDMKRTRLRVFGACAIFMGCFAMQLQFKQTVALSNNQANVQDVDRYFVYRLMYGRARSRLAAIIANKEIPRTMRVPIYSWYAKTFNANIDEIRHPLETYKSLQEFFTRTLKDNARPISSKITSNIITSPADAELVTAGEVKGDRVVQIKGATYSIRSLLGIHPTKRISTINIEDSSSEQISEPISNDKKLMYCVLYLAPGDYHHFHSPCDFNVSVRRHFPGEVLPVKKSLASTFNDLFTVNERVVLSGEWELGKMHYAAIAAYNVGDIQIHIDPTLKTNRVRTVPYALGGDSFLRMYDNGIKIVRGDDVGIFKLGSTVVLCFETPKDYEFAIPEGTKIKVNDILCAPKKFIEDMKKQ